MNRTRPPRHREWHLVLASTGKVEASMKMAIQPNIQTLVAHLIFVNLQMQASLVPAEVVWPIWQDY